MNPGSVDNGFEAVAVTSACNGWAVGDFQNGTAGLALIEQWNGKTWKRQRSTVPSSYANDLFGVAAVSPSDAWAVGFSDYSRTLVERWNGGAWKVQPSPNPGGPSSDDDLLAVAAVSSSDAWAVGQRTMDFSRTLIERWNGRAWKVQQSSNPAIRHNGIDVLYGVVAVSRTDAWAVGTDRSRHVYRTLIEHWNGKTWMVQPSPDPSSGRNELQGVTATSATDAWAVGSYTHGGVWRTLIEHWNGKRWKMQPSQSPAGDGDVLHAVAAASPTDAWAVGHANGAYQTLIEHWNGRTWEVQPSPTPSATFNDLYGVAAVSPTDVWAAGQYAPTSGPADLTLIEHWNGTAWTGEPASAERGLTPATADAPGTQGLSTRATGASLEPTFARPECDSAYGLPLLLPPQTRRSARCSASLGSRN